MWWSVWVSVDLDTLLRRSFPAVNGAAAALEVMAEEGEWLTRMMTAGQPRFAILTRPLGRSAERPSHAPQDFKRSKEWAPLTKPEGRVRQEKMNL
jgi:hypothetical protein